MTESVNKTFRRLSLVFWAVFIAAVVLYAAITALRLREIFLGGTASPAFERYAILATLICIPAALKIYRILIRKLEPNAASIKLGKYKKIYFLRLFILCMSLGFNYAGLYTTGEKNFFYMIFITIIAFLFCLPNKSEISALFEAKALDEADS